MKNFVIHLLVIALAAFMLSGCQNKASETPAPAGTATKPLETPVGTDMKPTETPAAATPTQTTANPTKPGPTQYTPTDILGEKLNPFFRIEFPKNFELENVFVYTPGWSGEGDAMQYHMHLLGPMHNDTIIAMARLLGVTAENLISGYLETFQKDGRVLIDGGGGRTCEIEKSPKNNGWLVHLVSIVERADEAKYSQFVRDNYNMNLFGPVARSLALLPVPDNFRINVCYVTAADMLKTEFEIVYTAENPTAVLGAMKNGGGYSWYDSDNHMFGIDYGKMYGNIRFAEDKKRITVTQRYKGVPDSLLCEYFYEPPLTLENYRFKFIPDQGISIFEEHDGEYSKLVFHSPQWGKMNKDWEVEFFYAYKKGEVVAWYRPQENKFDVRIQMGKSIASYAYNIEKNIFESVQPDKATVEKYLNTLYADPGIKDLYAHIFRVLERYSLDVAGISFEKLASLPPAPNYDYAPLSAAPRLPESGGTRTTLGTLEFKYDAGNGSYGYRGTDKNISIDMYNEKWKAQPEKWNRDVIRYYQNRKDYLLVIAYYPNRGRYEVQVFKGGKPTENGVQSYFAYDIRTDAVVDRITQGVDMKPEVFFAKALDLPQNDTIFKAVINIFDQYISATFGLKPDELFRLDAS